jgi:hypothetical protein
MVDTPNYTNSPLANPKFLENSSLTPKVSDYSSSKLADPRFQAEVAAKEVAPKQLSLEEQKLELQREAASLDDRSAGQILSDSLISGTNAAVSGLLSIGGIIDKGIGAAVEYSAPEGSLTKDFGGLLNDNAMRVASEMTDSFTGFTDSFKSDTAKRSAEIQGEISAIDNEVNKQQYEQDIASGDSEFISSLSLYGRQAIDFADRTLSDPVASGELVSNAVGSLASGSVLSKIGTKIATGVAERFGIEGVKRLGLEYGGSALGMGVTEASSTYTSTVSEVMGRTPEQMTSSDMYQELIALGMTHEEAQTKVADSAGLDAFVNQLPAAMTAGLLSAKFNANPLSTMRGENPLGVFITAGKEAMEEAAQGASGQYNQNYAIKDYVDPTQDLSEGVVDQAVGGLLGGFASSGIIGAPSGVMNGLQEQTERIRSEVAYDRFVKGIGDQIAESHRVNELNRMTPGERDSNLRSAFTQTSPGEDLFNSVIGKGAEALNALKEGAQTLSESDALGKTVEGIKTGVQAVKQAATPIVNEVIKTAQNYVDKPNPVIQNEIITAAQEVSVAVNDPAVETGDLGKPDESITKDIVPEFFKETVTEGSNIADTMVSIVQTLADKKVPISEMKDDAVLFVTEKFNQMQNAASALSPEVKAKVKKVLASPDLERIRKRAARLDLNTFISPTIERVSSLVKGMTVSMSRVNPSNVNPDVVDKILKQEYRGDLSPQDVKSLEVAASVTRPMNNYIKNIVKIQDDKNAFLVSTGQVPDKTENSVEAVSRKILEGGKTNQEKLPSVKTFANQIIVGMQSSDQSIDTGDTRIPVKQVAQQFGRLVQHMTNKVNALNASFDKRDQNGVGPVVVFDTLVNGKFIKAGMAGSKSANYSTRSINSTSFAKTVAADATVMGEIYNALVSAYPELFPNGVVTIPVLKTLDAPVQTNTQEIEDQKQNTTADEETLAAAKVDESAETNSKMKTLFDDLLEDAMKTIEEGDPEISIRITSSNEFFDYVSNNPLTQRVGGDRAYFLHEKVVQYLGIETQTEQTTEEAPQTTAVEDTTLVVSETPESNETKPLSDTKENSLTISTDDSQITESVKERKPVSDNQIQGKVSDRFGSVFYPKKTLAKSAEELLAQISEQPGSENYVTFSEVLLDRISRAMNARLQSVLVSKADGRTLAQALKETPDTLMEIRDFKPLMIVDPDTGIYDQKLLNLASMAVIDWMTTARPYGVDRVDDLLKELGLVGNDLTEEQIRLMFSSVPTRTTTESLARKVIKLWNVQPNKMAQMVDIRGTTEGLVKEIFTVLSEMEDSLVKVREIKVGKGYATTFDISALKAEQTDIGLAALGSLDKLMFPEDKIMISFGEKISHVDSAQNNKPDVRLTEMERKALKNMQDIPHTEAVPVVSFFKALGLESWSSMVGKRDSSKLAKRHSLRLTIEGKNLSIERDFEDALEVVNTASGKEVFYPFGITNVGRHQMRGINPQNNKVLRAMMTPTHAKLDMVNNQKHKDAFWLTVVQSSEIAKVEKKDHTKILSTVQEEFNQKFGEATAIAVTFFETGSLNSSAFAEAMLRASKGAEVTVAQVNAVIAVARLQQAQKAGTANSFETSLSFELDGKTDGAANMMAAFGQGIMTMMEYMNFKRVGFFLGSNGETLNTFLSENQDLYEVNSFVATRALNKRISEATGLDRKRLIALQRFAYHFGDLTINSNGEIELSRASSKNPMTKKVYGSLEKGIAEGISQDMVIEFYNQLTNLPDGVTVEDHLNYQEINEDLQFLFGTKLPAKLDVNDFILPWSSMAPFSDFVKSTFGEILSDSINGVMSEKTIGVNDLLVFTTGVQGEFMKLYFEQRLAEAMGELTEEFGQSENQKKGKPTLRKMSQERYDAIVKETLAFAPYFSDGLQNLRIGDFTGQQDDTEMSSNLNGNIRAKSTMQKPDDIGVKGIPYVIQGRGDAMMMNRIFSADNSPKKAIPIFDGIDLSITDFSDLSNQINEAVLENWDHDVLGPVKDNFDRFLKLVQDEGLEDKLFSAFAVMKKNSKNKNQIRAYKPNDLVDLLANAKKLNQARKAVFKKITVSVDHMGGSGQSFVRNVDGKTLSFEEINTMIQNELSGQSDLIESTVVTEEVQKDQTIEPSLVVTDVATMTDSLMRESKPYLRDVVRSIRGMMSTDALIVMGTEEEINAWRGENLNKSGNKLEQKTSGYYDVENNIIFILSDNPETIVHEMIHMATFQAVLDHYNNVKKSTAVKNLEVLMEEFLALDTSTMSAEAQDVYLNAKVTIVKGKSESTSMGDAIALNEFMAWSLANESLMKELKQTPTSLIARLTKAAKAWIQKILNVVPQDMYSNILFNTEMLHNDEFPGGFENVFENENTSGEVTPSADKFTNFWIDLLKEKIDAIQTTSSDRVDTILKGKAQDQIIRYSKNADKILTQLDFAGFGFSEYQKKTFSAIHMVIAIELQLEPITLVQLGKVYEHVVNNLTPAMFGKGQIAQDRYSALMNLMGSTKNDQGISDAIGVLLAMSQTSTLFRSALDQIPKPDNQQGIETTSLNDVLSSSTSFLMQKLVASTDLENKGVKSILDDLSEGILRQDNDTEFRALKTLMDTFSKGDKFVNGMLSKLAQKTRETNQEFQRTAQNGVLKTVANSVTLATQFMDANLSASAGKGAKEFTHMNGMLDGAVAIRELVNEIIGADSINNNTIQMLDKVNYVVQGTRQAYREELPVILQNEFDNHPTAEQWKNLHHVLGKTDFASLFDLKDPDASFDLMNDVVFLDQRIRDQEKKIMKAYPKLGRLMLTKAQQLANYMNGKGAGFQLFKNAYAIHKLVGGDKNAMVKQLDILISLYAISGSDIAQRESVARMQASDPKGVHNLLVYIQALNKEEDQKVVSEAARMNGYKGYIPDHSKGEISLIIAKDSDKENLLRRGYKRIEDDTTYTGSLVSRGYYMSTAKQAGNYSQGVLQQVQDTYRGVNAVTGLTVNGTTSGVISGSAVITITEALNNELSVVDDKNVLIPVYDEDGGVLYYERALNPDMIQKYLEPESNMALMVGVWAGRQVEEKFSYEYNKALVTELKKIWDKREKNSDGMFVRMDQAEDKIYAESWNVIPPQLKEHILSVFGEETGFMVRKDMINLALGYRDASITDVWTGNHRLPEGVELAVKTISKRFMGDKGFSWLGNVETFAMDTISGAKDLIVVRSLVVPFMNTQSNVFQLVNRGIGTKAIMKGYRDKFVEIDQLNENLKKIMGLEARIRLAANDKNKVAILKQQMQVLKDENKRFSVAPLVEAGAYKSISEGITELDVAITNGRLGDWFESKVSKLPSGLQTTVKYGLLSKDTAIYKGANKAVQYGDFVAKSIYYDDLVFKGLTHDQAMSKVNEEFVNFSLLPGRARTYLESMGATWFLTFKIRSMKVALQMIRDNPVRSLAMMNVVGIESGPITDNVLSKLAEGTLPYSLGWDMLWDAPGMNPWVTLTSG